MVIEGTRWGVRSGELWRGSKQRMTVQWLRMVHLAGRGNPQLRSKDVGPSLLPALWVCPLASLRAQGFMEPPQCSRTKDEKGSWSGKRCKLNGLLDSRDNLGSCFRLPIAFLGVVCKEMLSIFL